MVYGAYSLIIVQPNFLTATHSCFEVLASLNYFKFSEGALFFSFLQGFMNMLLFLLPGASLCLLLPQKKIWLISAHPMSKKAHITSSGKSLILQCERSLNYMWLQLSVLLCSKHCQLLVYCLYFSLSHKLTRTELGILIVMSFVCSTVVIHSRDSMEALDKFTHYFLQVAEECFKCLSKVTTVN